MMIRQIVAGMACLIVFISAGAPKPLTALSHSDILSESDGSDPWLSLAAGIDYREFFLADPNRVYVTRLDRQNSHAIIDTSLANGSLSAGLEPISAQADRYDQALSFRDGAWGGRYQVVAAINGGFFDTTTGFPTGGIFHSGWYALRFSDRQTIGGFAWRSDRQSFIIECTVQPPGKQRLILMATDESIPFQGINSPREKDELILYTPQYGPTTPVSESGLEILVELGRPLMLLPESEVITGTVREIRKNQGQTLLPFDHIVFSADGEAAQAMSGKFMPGDQVGVKMEVRHLDDGCRKERSEGLEGTVAGVTGSYVFLRDGKIQAINDLGSVLRNPRTAVALNDRYIYFIVVDGRDQLRSLGMSMVELALFAKLRLSATWGVAMDGGGSSTMVVNGEVKNNPNAETMMRIRPDKTPRAVANGLMMAIWQPPEHSQRFQVGMKVVISSAGDANLRLGPGINYASLAVLSAGTQGVILDHPLDGILAKGYHWWQVAFGDQVGWVSESVLEPEE